ncbi:hypothetical protein RND81_06G030200 [Saponaria officinalis]|uniref:Epidermal patterning factor-like protein n=1 Tax=Saponaria officinalis TaxID=3572 RepID=A0AAW1K3X6_SAPOF
MAINSSFFYKTFILLFFLCFPLFFSPVFALFMQHHSPVHAREMLFEEKSRLGSTPPSCYNKCNQCHPCTAVQVPTLPSLHRIPPSPPPLPSSVSSFEFNSALWDNNRYSNYKPLGWKCCCKNHFYNP